MTVSFERIPALADCSGSGLHMVEGYSPNETTSYGSLDVRVYVCADHREDAREWVRQRDLMPHNQQGQPNGARPCGYYVDFGPLPPAPPGVRGAKGLGLLEPMPYRLAIGGRVHARGTLQEIRAAVAAFVTTKLAINPVSFARDAQLLNRAFNEGFVQRAVEEKGKWETIVGAEGPALVEIWVEREG